MDHRSVENVERLTLMHLDRYAVMIASASRGDASIRVWECMNYLQLWKSIADKGFKFEALDEDELFELECAISDEDENYGSSE